MKKQTEMAQPVLLTPGPLTTAPETRHAMLRDWGARDRDFVDMTARVRSRLLAMAGGGDCMTAVPMQGSGTFAVEAMLASLVPPQGKVLILENGAYGRRMAEICRRIGRNHIRLSWPEDEPVGAARLADALENDPSFSHVALVHVETTSGILNPLPEIAALVADAGAKLLIDAMSAFGAVPLDARQTPFEALAASSNKCLEGAPGLGFVTAHTEALDRARGNAPSLSLDLHDQWRGFENNGQWRFTPPTHVVAALDAALLDHATEGGVAGRGARYRQNCRILRQGMAEIGFSPFLAEAVQAPVIVTFLMPRDPAFDFRRFYDGLYRRGFVIYPGKLTKADSFRVGCIGQVDQAVMRDFLHAVRQVVAEIGVSDLSP
ncbi:MAG: 2-aminoethylphosphonate--pyruvate transaminase [Sphingomonadales bacterium]